MFMNSRRKLFNIGNIRRNRSYRTENDMPVNKKSKRKYFYVLLGICVLIVVFGFISYFNGDDTKNTEVAGKNTSIKGIIAEQEINREFSFPLKDEEGNEISSVKFELEKAQLRDTVLVQGQQAYATEGKIFLVINLKITNELDQAIEMNTKDFVRLVAEGREDEQLAPEMHNDPVQILAISTKHTRVGFSVNKDDTEFVLKVGEINGEKQDVPLNLSK